MLFREKKSVFFQKTLLSWVIIFHGVIMSFAEVPGIIGKPSTLFLRKVEQAPVIDGNLSDPCWKNAPKAKDFIQRQPDEGQPVTEKTEVRVCRDENTLFIGVRCFDSQPQKIAAIVREHFFFLLRDVRKDDPRHLSLGRERLFRYAEAQVLARLQQKG